MQDQKTFMNNEVELFKEGEYWFVTDCEAGGYCKKYFNYTDALKDYENRVKRRIEKHYTKSKSA